MADTVTLTITLTVDYMVDAEYAEQLKQMNMEQLRSDVDLDNMLHEHLRGEGSSGVQIGSIAFSDPYPDPFLRAD